MTKCRRGRLTAVLPLLAGLMASGCDPPREDLRPVVNELVQKQAAQQESLLRQSEQLSEASRQLVESDADARRELVEFQSTLQSQIEDERQNLDHQRNDLKQERRDSARQRHRDPLIAAALLQAATLIVAALPIVFIVLLLRAARNEPADGPMGELLVHELSSERPILMPLSSHSAHRLKHDAPAAVEDASDTSGRNPPA